MVGALVGSTTTSMANVILLTRQRLGTVESGGRGAQVPAVRQAQVRAVGSGMRGVIVTPDR
jgi:hypothetical protein